MQTEPLDGVRVTLPEDGNLFTWHIGIFGPPDTIYTGGYYKAELKFPDTYPFNPPKMRIITPIFHPNVYADGNICISILHPPGEDEMSGERPEERWNPTQTVRTILLSVISILNEPNTSSPANVDASVSFRKWRLGESDDYERRVRAEVETSKLAAEQDGVTIPLTMDEYIIKHKPAAPEPEFTMDDSDSDADYGYDDDDDNSASGGDDYEEDDDDDM